MSTTAARPTTNASRHPTTGQPNRGSRRWIAALAIVLAASTLVALRLLGGSPERPAPTTTHTVGTVNSSGYDRSITDFDWSIGYGPGSTLYREQVPSHVDAHAAYGPGSSLYRSQVPSGR